LIYSAVVAAEENCPLARLQKTQTETVISDSDSRLLTQILSY
jgi:hypothetical protein